MRQPAEPEGGCLPFQTVTKFVAADYERPTGPIDRDQDQNNIQGNIFGRNNIIWDETIQFNFKFKQRQHLK